MRANGDVTGARRAMRLRPALIALALALAACGKRAKDADEESEGPSKPALVDVVLDSLTAGNVEETVAATGATGVLRKETVASPVAGRVVSVKVTEGQSLAAGTVVAVVRTKESESALEGARALLDAARTDAERQEAKRALDLAQATQTALPVRAKQGGVVARRLVQEGEQVSEKDSLVAIVDLSTLDFRAEVPLSAIGRVKVGQSATVAFPGLPETLPARVAAVLPEVQAASQTLPVRLAFAGVPAALRAALKTDLPGEARIVVGKRSDVLLAPKAAILRDDEKGISSLAVMRPDSVARLVEVRTGAAEGDRLEVAGEGLRPGLPVIVQGQYGLPDSTRVRPVWGNKGDENHKLESGAAGGSEGRSSGSGTSVASGADGSEEPTAGPGTSAGPRDGKSAASGMGAGPGPGASDTVGGSRASRTSGGSGRPAAPGADTRETGSRAAGARGPASAP